MVVPVPGHTPATPYGARGPYWSCDRDGRGYGIHTGVDYPAPTGAAVVAARPGTLAWCHHGDAFGYHQVEVRPGDGTRDFYAHLSSRIANGTRVEAGQRIGAVGAEGNATGPHLHFERHATATGGWTCEVVRDPAPSIAWHEEDEDMPLTDADLSKIREVVKQEVQAAKDDYARVFLAAEVDSRDPEPTTVKKSLRLTADHARGFPANGE